MAEFNYNRIKAELAEQHLTSKWLAEQMGKSETTVSRWVSNKAQPSVEQLYEIARLLKVEVFNLQLRNNGGNNQYSLERV